MQLRKLIGFGKNSYIVSIPKDWINKNELKKGDLMSIEESEHGLLLAANAENKKKEPKTITIEAENKSLDLIRAEIVSAYLNNYGIIEIISRGLKTNAEEIKNILRNLTSLEIIEQTATRMVAKDLVDINEVSIPTVIRRMDIITRAMIEDGIKSIDEDHYESLRQRDADVNRLHFLGYRVVRSALINPRIARDLKTNSWELQCYKMVIMRLEKIADRQKRIARYLKETDLSKETADELKKLYSEIKDRYLEVMKAFYTNDVKLALNVEIKNKSRIEACDKFLEKHSYCPLAAATKMKSKKCDKILYCINLARIVENLKAMVTSIKYIARTTISMEK